MVHLVHCDLTLLGSAGFAEREEVLPKHFFGAYAGEVYDPTVNANRPRDAPYEYFGFCDTKPLYGNLEEGYPGYRPLAQRQQVCPVHSNPDWNPRCPRHPRMAIRPPRATPFWLHRPAGPTPTTLPPCPCPRPPRVLLATRANGASIRRSLPRLCPPIPTSGAWGSP